MSENTFSEQGGADHILSEYGAPVPVIVTETLTLAERHTGDLMRHSVQLDSNGWAWMVYDRKVIIWFYKTQRAGLCYELMLPVTNTYHRARLIHVFESTDRKSVSCIAVSPEGTVRFWHDVILEGTYAELKIDIGADECVMLAPLSLRNSFSCIIGTIASTLIAVNFLQQNPDIKHRVLKIPQGRFAGFSRRVSSMFFGSTPQPTTTTATLCCVLAGEMLNHDTQALYVLTNEDLQKWAVGVSTEKILYQLSVESLFRENIAQILWNQEPERLLQLKTELMDMQLISDGVIVFGGSVNADISGLVRYALGTLHTEGDDPPQSFLSFSLVNHCRNSDCDSDPSEKLPSYRLLLPRLASRNVFLYDNETVICITDGRPDQAPDVVDFANLGAGCIDGIPVFLSNQGVVVCVQDNVAPLDTSVGDALLKTTTFAALDTSIVSSAKRGRIAVLRSSDDMLSRFKAAFLASIQEPEPAAQVMINELFPSGVTQSTNTGSTLDVLVSELSQFMIDDYPASDPRWGDSLPQNAGSSSTSLILLQQLNDKSKAHDLFLRFLKNVGLWDRLYGVAIRDTTMSTRMLLCEHAEKLESAKALREIHREHVTLIDDAITRVVRERGSSAPSPSSLTPQDLFYREVSRIDDLLPSLVDHETEILDGDLSSHDILQIVSGVNSIIMTMLYSGLQYRQKNVFIYQRGGAPKQCSEPEEYMAWTTSSYLRTVLRRQHGLTVSKGLTECETSQEKGTLFQQLFELTDLLLDGFRVHLESLRQSSSGSAGGGAGQYAELLQRYERERNDLIEPFIVHKQYERATSLAEKYCHFGVLVQLCEELDHPDRLKRYMDEFKDKGFSDFVFKWYMDAGKRGKLMTSDLSANPLLSRFLETKENQFMSWLHNINAGEYYQAHATLLDLARDESRSAGKKKTLLSLCKLAALASDDPPASIQTILEEVDNDLDLLLHQEQLLNCPEIKHRLGIDDLGNMKVLTPVELIENETLWRLQMDSREYMEEATTCTIAALSYRLVLDQFAYDFDCGIMLQIGEYNVDANEFDFKKSLDLVSFIKGRDLDVDSNELLLKIWSQAILKNRWEGYSATDPMATCKDTIFFRTVELALAENMNLDQYLPTVDKLLESDLLSNITHSETFQSFQFLLGVMYERIQQIIAQQHDGTGQHRESMEC